MKAIKEDKSDERRDLNTRVTVGKWLMKYLPLEEEKETATNQANIGAEKQEGGNSIVTVARCTDGPRGTSRALDFGLGCCKGVAKVSI
jgi:hypothetical protein